MNSLITDILNRLCFVFCKHAHAKMQYKSALYSQIYVDCLNIEMLQGSFNQISMKYIRSVKEVKLTLFWMQSIIYRTKRV